MNLNLVVITENQAEAASSAGEISFRAFMAAIKSATTNMAMLQRVEL